ncbi:MAG: hypothetical protein ABI330_01885 [Caldimonas sp.]
MTTLNMAEDTGGANQCLPDVDAAYRNYLADLIMDHATDRGVLRNNPEAYRRVMAVTGRTLGTVKNWLANRTTSPDVASLARIVDHWAIPPAAIYPPQLAVLLGRASEGTLQYEPLPKPESLGEYVLISFNAAADSENAARALSKYTDRPQSALLVRQVGGDMVDEIRPGELMLVDAGQEHIDSSGIYMLRISSQGSNSITCVRFVERLLAQPTVRLRGGSTSSVSTVETFPLVDGVISGVTVLARVLGVLRQL